MTWPCRRLHHGPGPHAAASSAWTQHTVQEHIARITTEHGVQATPAELREFISLATKLAVSDCFSVLPPGAPTPEHVAHLTSLSVIAAETALRNARDAQARAAVAHAEADALRDLPVNEAARRIEAKRAQREQIRRQSAQRERQREPFERNIRRPDPDRGGPTRGL